MRGDLLAQGVALELEAVGVVDDAIEDGDGDGGLTFAIKALA